MKKRNLLNTIIEAMKLVISMYEICRKEETAINVRFFYNYKLILVMTIERGMQKTSFTCDMVHDL